MSIIQLSNVNQYFDKNHVLKQINLEVEEGDFMTFLGPSGCGKTTTLRIIAGLEKPESGIVTIQGKIVDHGEMHVHAAPSARGLSLVFQSYALWPHMTIFDNVSFGLEVKKIPKAEIRKKVELALEKMRIRDLIDRYPSELSGGQQQRVAIARAIVTEPKILLLDEPLSNLDAKLRIEMRTELKRLHRDMKTTIIYVTHDQVEALTMSTKIALFFDGKIVQVDTPRGLYRNPGTLQAADFIGNPSINLIEARSVEAEGMLRTTSSLGQLDFFYEGHQSGEVVLALKPEDIHISRLPSEGAIPCQVYSVLPAGSETLIQLQQGDRGLLAKTIGEVDYEMDSTVWISFPADKINVYDKLSEKLISKNRI
ncbi:ABC transporter ATP-binding protein [Paenibacillus radicis (ex Xue et al. 2023)]|uniref:ABC transporter ATP-binding protein n=1 Tax=Paenibacillus radicis (ex Xue et al. 2023) TaxID=2972489 RepID=A0ABT1YK87_9BACL|nr:ABC transporter ATP-binding protein [Paenibacillus radicis (ex Xue et al. 2023)]MCR8633140.1 ABC transporter ATP-binding protein [Paenibacillus radicis (ex Xue et al. 2023)]